MHIMHLSDLHIGKRLNEFSLIEDQAHILAQILQIAGEQRPDVVLIAGDIYDKAIPSAEAVELFDDFLFRLAALKMPIIAISGNHDSPERIAFGGRILCQSNLFLSPVYNGRVDPVTLTDEFGPVDFYSLPFIKPVHVRRIFPSEPVERYHDAVSVAINHMPIRPERRNVLVTHQFITGATRSESEDISVGGTDNVDASLFNPFDYVALGHLHAPQCVSREGIRYCGAPLKYDFSESAQEKSVTLVELGAKGALRIQQIPLTPLRDLRKIRSNYMEITRRDAYLNTPTEDYLYITLTDEQDVPDAIRKLRTIYPNIMKLDYDNRRTSAHQALVPSQILANKRPAELFSDFYAAQNGQPPSETQLEYLESLITPIWEVAP